MTLHERLEALFEARWPEPALDCDYDCDGDCRFCVRQRRRNNFVDFLDINTPESLLAAALMCVPEGWGMGLGQPSENLRRRIKNESEHYACDIFDGKGTVSEARGSSLAEALITTLEQIGKSDA